MAMWCMAATPVPPPTPRPEIFGVTADSSTVVPGESVTISVNANLATTHAWMVTSSGETYNMYPAMGVIESKYFSASFTPVVSGNVTVYANTNSSTSGAVSRSIYIGLYEFSIHPI